MPSPGASALGAQRRLLRTLTLLAVLLLVGSVAWFSWHERQQEVEAATAQSVRRAAHVADELSQALRLARVATEQADARLQRLPPGASLNDVLGDPSSERAQLLATLALSFELHALDREGRALDLAPGSGGHSHEGKQPAGHVHGGSATQAAAAAASAAAARWQVGDTRGAPHARVIPLRRAAAPNPHGVVAYAVDLSHTAVVRRFDAERPQPGGGVALFRLEPDGSTTVLARAPHNEDELGQRLRGPLAESLARAPAGVFEALTQIDQVHRVVAYQRLGGDAADLVVASGTATDAVLAGWRRSLPWSVAIALLLATGMLWGGWRLERSMGALAANQQALEQSENHFRALAGNLPDVVVRMDRHGRHLYVNAAVRQATGLAPEAFIGKTNAELGMPAENVAVWMATLGRVFDAGQAERLEFAFPGPRGLRQWESIVTLEPAADRAERAALVISRDITERRQSEAAREALNRRLADVLESMSDGFVSLDRDWRYVALNAKAGELLGREPASLIGKHIWTEFPEGVGQPFHRAYERAMNEGVTVVLEEHYAPWGRWFENRIHPSADGIAIFFTDVTERRRTADALRDSEQRLREAQQLAALGSWELDLRSRALHWSEEVFRIFEIDPARFGASYDAFLALIHPDDRAAVDEAYRRSLAEHRDYAISHRLLFADARIKHVHEQGRSFYADDGTPLRSVGTVQDITQRVLAEQALRASEASHREMFEANPHPMWVFDLGTLAFLAVNDAAVRKYGYSRDEFLRMTIKDIRPPEDVPRLLANVAAVHGGLDDAGTWRHRTKDGRLLEVEITSHTLRFAGRDAELVLAHDVTRRIQAERTLHDNEERLRLALQAANQGLYDLDLRTGEAVVSPEYALMLGYDPAHFHETNAAWRERLHPDDRTHVEQVYLDYVAGRRPDYRVEFRQRMRDGTWKWILSLGRIQQRDADGTPLRMLGTHTDLDAIKAAQAAQEAAAQRFEKLFEAAPEAISVSELDSGRFLQVNDAFCELFGHAREQILGRTSVESDMWSDTARRQQIVEQLRAGEGVHGFEGVARHGDGTPIDVLFSAERIDFDGRDALLLMFRDISQRKRLERALQASEARLAHLLARAPTVIYTARAEGDFAATYYSPNLPELLGWPPQRFLDEPSFWLDHVHPDDRAAAVQSLEALATQDDLVLEYRFAHADGRWLWMRDQISVQRDAGGAPIELVGAWIDITARREAEDEVRRLAAELEQRVQQRTAELSRSEARYRTIFEAVPVAISEEDWSVVQGWLRELRSAGVADGAAYFAQHPDFVQRCLEAVRMVRLNRRALAMHDASDKGAELPTLKAFYPAPQDLPQFIGELEAMWNGTRLYTAKKSLPAMSGRPLSLMVSISMPAMDDADGTALACLVDITEIDRLNAELDRSLARLRKANKELETFTYSVSHDLKAPLRGIDGYSRLLLTDHRDQLDEEGRQFLSHIRRATQHMGVLIDDLLSYSRLERSELTLAPLALDELVDGVLAPYRNDLATQSVELRVALPQGLRVLGDAQGLVIALRNLVDNAIKFSRDRQPPRIEIAAARAGNSVRLAVRDNGLGFDMKFHDRIFAIFQRLHRAEDYPGTGVGLAIVRKAMERMGGRVWAESAPGQGATFTIELPEAA